MRRIGRWLPRALFESFLIVFSILLALGVNEWRDNRERYSRAREARHAFANEIRANRDLLVSKDYLEHHKRLQAEYEELAKGGSGATGSMFESGVHPAPLRDASWRSFSSSSVLVDLPPADVLLLSDIYRAQDQLEKLNTSFLATVLTPRADRETPAYQRDENRSIFMFLSDVVPAEERLVRQYERALAQLEKE